MKCLKLLKYLIGWYYKIEKKKNYLQNLIVFNHKFKKKLRCFGGVKMKEWKRNILKLGKFMRDILDFCKVFVEVKLTQQNNFFFKFNNLKK